MKKEILLLFWGCFNVCFAQTGWSLQYHNYEILDSVYSIRPLVDTHSDQFKFYDEANFGKSLLGGICLSRIDSSTLQYKIEFDNVLRMTPSELGYYMNFFTESISNYEILFISSLYCDTLKIKIPVYSDGYQYPYTNSNTVFDKYSYYSDEKSKLYWQVSDTVEINSILFKACSNGEESKFVIGDFNVFRIMNTIEKVRHPILGSNSEDKAKNQTSYYKIDTENTPLFYSLFKPSYFTRGDWFINTTDEISESSLLIDIFKMCIKYYPFYEERCVNKQVIEDKFATIINNNTELDYSELTENLSEIANMFNDGHFKLLYPQKKSSNKMSPIQLYKIDSNYYLSAIFQKNSDKSLIGKRIVSIDGINIDEIETIFGANKFQISFEDNLKQYLAKSKSDSTILCLAKNPVDTIVTVYYKEPIFIPENFKPKHRKFEILSENIAYYRLNNFIPGDYVNFISKIDLLQNSKGIIIDLRGNGGGNSMIAMSLFSLFIKKPTVYEHCIDYYGNKSSMVVKPNLEYFIDKPIVLLIDNNTACASETFIDAMRMSTNTTVFGKSHTSGTLATLVEINFPSGVKLKTNIFSDRILTATGRQIENIGITPDIYVAITNVDDLYPYKDKILNEACKYILFCK